MFKVIARCYNILKKPEIWEHFGMCFGLDTKTGWRGTKSSFKPDGRR